MTRVAPVPLVALVLALAGCSQGPTPTTATCPSADDAGAPPLVACGGVCVDARFDAANCGACGVACRGAPHTQASCVRGECVVACEPGSADGDGDLGAQGSNGCEASTGEGPGPDPGWVLGFDRSLGDYLRVARADDLEPVGAFTLEAWVRSRDLPHAEQDAPAATILCKSLRGAPGPLGPHGYSYALFFEDEAIQARLVPNEQFEGWNWSWPSDGRWHHVALVHGGTPESYLRWCTDGTCYAWAPLARPGAPRYEAEDLYIGIDALDGVFSRPFDGWLDDVRIWSVARTPEEVLGDMRSPPSPAPGLVAGWSFDEGEGDVAHDASGNGHDAVFGSMSGTGPAWVRSDRR